MSAFQQVRRKDTSWKTCQAASPWLQHHCILNVISLHWSLSQFSESWNASPVLFLKVRDKRAVRSLPHPELYIQQIYPGARLESKWPWYWTSVIDHSFIRPFHEPEKRGIMHFMIRVMRFCYLATVAPTYFGKKLRTSCTLEKSTSLGEEEGSWQQIPKTSSCKDLVRLVKAKIALCLHAPQLVSSTWLSASVSGLFMMK